MRIAGKIKKKRLIFGHFISKTEQRKADQHYGEAVGIEQALATLSFTHDRMKELSKLL